MWYRCNISGKPHQIKSGLTDKFFRWKLSNRISAFWWTAWQLAPIGLAVHSRYSLDDLMYDSKRIAGQVFRLSICFSVSSKMLFSLLVYFKLNVVFGRISTGFCIILCWGSNLPFVRQTTELSVLARPFKEANQRLPELCSAKTWSLPSRTFVSSITNRFI